MPSEVDSVSIWDDILVWRTQLFHLCVSSFKQATSPKASNGESSSAASILNANMSKIHDEAWTTLQLCTLLNIPLMQVAQDNEYGFSAGISEERHD